MTDETASAYGYPDAAAAHTEAYLWSPVLEVLGERRIRTLFELGCGNGAFARHLKSKGYEVSGVDPSMEGIAIANESDPSICLRVGSAYDPLSEQYGTFSAVVSLEVVEHVYYPRKYASCVAGLLKPGGIAIVSTPYHGYIKNIALAVTGKLDSHFTALWDYGHIKFWSVRTLTELFSEQGLRRESVLRVGRVPWLAKSMILVFRKP